MRPRHHRIVRWHADLRQKRHAARGDVRRRRIQQRAVIGERDVVQVEMRVLRLERAPAAVGGLHADDPLARSRDRLGITRDRRCDAAACRRPRCRRRPGNADWRTGTPSRPAAARAAAPPSRRPRRGSARSRSQAHAACVSRAGLGHRVAGQPGVPDRRQAGLAIGTVRLDHQQLAHRAPGDGGVADDPADSPACRTSSRCWRWPG